MPDVNTDELPPLVVGISADGFVKTFRPIIVGSMVWIPVLGFFAVLLAAFMTQISGIGIGLAFGSGMRQLGRHRIAIFSLIAGLTSDISGVQTTIKPAAFRRMVKKGFHIGSAGIEIPLQTVLDAAAALTAGRLTVR